MRRGGVVTKSGGLAVKAGDGRVLVRGLEVLGAVGANGGEQVEERHAEGEAGRGFFCAE